MMPKPLVRIVCSVGTALAAVWLGATPVLAAPTSWTVTNPNSDGSFAITDAVMALRNTTTGDVITCPTPQTTAGELRSGTYGAPDSGGTPLGSLWAEHHCTDASGTPVTVTHGGRWTISAEAYEPASGRTTGVMSPDLLVSFVIERPGCQYLVDGWFDIAPLELTYTNATSTLTVSSSSLPLYDVTGTGCDGLAHDDDVVTYSGTYTLAPAITIVGT